MSMEQSCLGLKFRGHCRERALLGLDGCDDCINKDFRELDNYEHCGECKDKCPYKILCKGCKKYFLYVKVLYNQNMPKYCRKCEEGKNDRI